MASEPPPQSWISRNAHVFVWLIAIVLGAYGLTWLIGMPPITGPAPPAVQTSQPQPAAAGSRVTADQTAIERVAAERAAADQRAFAEATQAGTVAAFETYVRDNPAGARIAEAQQRIAALNEQARRAAEERTAAERAATERAAAERAAAERTAADERAFAEATQVGTIAAFETYVRNNPAGARVTEAQQRIAALNEQTRRAAEERAAAERTEAARVAEAQAATERAAARAAEERAAAERAEAAKAAEDRAWIEAAQAGTVAALESYIRNHPAGTRIAEAQQRIAVISEQARRVAEERAAAEKLAADKAAAEKVAAERAADDRAFAEAAQGGSIAAYEAYIRNNAAGAHLIEAARRIGQLRDAERIKQADATKPARVTSSSDVSRPYVPQRPVYKAPPLQR